MDSIIAAASPEDLKAAQAGMGQDGGNTDA